MNWTHAATAAALVLTLSGAAPAGAAVINRIAAIVNGDVITTHQVDKKLAQHKKQLKNPAEIDGKEARRQVLNVLIEETLVKQRIDKLRIEVSDSQIEATIEDVQKKNGMTREQLREALRQQGMSFEDYRENLRMQLLRIQLIGQDVRKNVVVTEQEMRDYFEEHSEDYRQAPFLRLGYLDLAFDGPRARAEIRNQARDIQQQLRRGADFAKVLRTVSRQDHVSGGDLGKIRFEDLDPTYAGAVRGLPEKGVSEILEVPGALRLLYLQERNPGEIKSFDQVRAEIEKTLTDQRMEEHFREWAKNLREDARIEILL
jgi:peptidyl-prolyl cis-trans isomerase SurA